MAEFSAPFDGSPIATQSQWSRMARRWGIDGVHADDPASTTLKVTGNGSGNVSLATGEAFVNGFYYKNDAARTIAVTANAGSSARIDMVVLRASMSAKTVTAQYKTGGTSAPTLATDEAGIYEMPLAQCTVAAGSSVVTAVNVADRRWFTGRGSVPGIAGARRPSVKGQLLVEGGSLYVGDGAGWQWLATAGIEDSTYTPAWSAGTTAINWGSGSQNIGRYQAVGRRVDLTIQLIPTGNPVAYTDPIQVTLPPGLPCTSLHRSIFTWNFNSSNGDTSMQGIATTHPTDSTLKIARLRYPTSAGNGPTALPDTKDVMTNFPINIRTDDVLTIDGTYWLA
ncbi:hypothetical protein [Streptomyces sp. NBC_00338]|uniref:hypothetical protein n=1 Tax=Streptomyces sp. NBC_00338 TaxID=2975715 RepID=UPI002256C55B|nr:hypothetical protein [Streptomyces sp. NBC_00338]MCX5144627.1 hypothetical protein [Streptomyces sp. NBC_00338]MCX5145077.1 hypothetical protein [Streptomyces sp. NBC_00338]